MSAEKNTDVVTLDAGAIDKIDHFLRPKRRAEVFSILSERGETSQKDIAKLMESTATALSNVLVVFSSFEYKLVEFSSVGKYRFYRLSAIGEAYLRAKAGAPLTVGGECGGKEGKLTSEAKAAFQEFASLSPFSWEVVIYHLLEKRSYGREVGDGKWKLELAEGDYEKAEQALDQYLACAERAELENDNVALNQILDLIENKILRDLISSIVSVFNQFSGVIKALSDKRTWAEAYMVVKNAFGAQDDQEVNDCLEALGWTWDMFKSLRDTADTLKENTAHMKEKEMCRYFLGLFPEQGGLCAYIARCISDVR